ncbi:hypothetical protein TSUD_163230 [Trifolium subterraneum]|uniref:DUF3527 domain-containing protein n=1 Tax=Trifolium subterraneum TaxID=3900 RepID=A0A2Z6NDR4_TRISU|nr:hypothetical protein TSUD_163230 [Trifolium subterraneum]
MWSDNLDLRPQKGKAKQKISSKSALEPVKQYKSKTKSVVDSSQKPKLVTLGEILKCESVNESSLQHEELVKHMSNLPGYLKRSDRGKNIQEKALNFGVLDWSRLENWKNKQSFNSNEESSSSSRAAATSSSTSRRHKKLVDRKGLSYSSIKGSYKETFLESSKLSSKNVKQYRNSGQTVVGEENRMRSREFESIGRIQLDKSLQKGKRCDYDVEAMSMQGLRHHSHKKKDRSFCSNFDNRLPSFERKDKGISFISENKMSSRSHEAEIKKDQWRDSDIDVDQKHFHSMPRDIVLLRPRKFLQSNFEDYFPLSQSIASSDDNFSESSLTSSSYISLPEEAYTENVLPSMTDIASSSETTRDSFDTDLDVDFSSVRSNQPSCSNRMSSFDSKDTYIEKDVFNTKLRNQCSFSNIKESTETDMNSLSGHQLSFDLNRIGRSLSFKEGPTLPKQSSMQVSAKSGPLKFESANLNNSSKDHKVNGHKRNISSTFMRLLDPIWKYKTSNTHHSSESILSSKGSPNSTSFRTNDLHDDKSKESSMKALLQLTIKNGLPLFHFVINSERKVLAATMNSLASSEKDDGSCYFTFYLLNEIKKKSGRWTSQWSKEKNCGGYAYNIAGHMKISNSRITESKDQSIKGQCMVKDYVLFGTGIDRPEQGPQEFVKRKELAAAVIEIPCENDMNLMKKECLKCLLADKRCFCIPQENDISGSSITVILPGGLHASPNKGEPSPLIHRWKLGGICDCGGRIRARHTFIHFGAIEGWILLS